MPTNLKKLRRELELLESQRLDEDSPWPWRSPQSDIERGMKLHERFWHYDDGSIREEIKDLQKRIKSNLDWNRGYKKQIKILESYLTDERRRKAESERQNRWRKSRRRDELRKKLNICDLCKKRGHWYYECAKHEHSPNYMSDCSECARRGCWD